MSIYQAKKTGTTEAGNSYIILQDGPKSFHVSVMIKDHLIYEHFEDPPNLEFLDNGILTLEKELVAKLP
jgi:hypothetical protein